MPRGISGRTPRRREHLEPHEIKRLLDASKTASRNPTRDFCMLLLTFRHGLRASEVCQMKLTDVDLKMKILHTPRGKGCDEACHELYNGESSAIKAWLVERAKMNPPESCDALFISERRKPMSRGTFWLLVTQIGKAAGMSHLSLHPHMLRHSTGFDLINRNVDIRTISGFLGHKSLSSTHRYTALNRTRFRGLFK
jgi:type 1 fimbriae regulatory protein FimB